MSFFGDVHRTGAGKSIQRSADTIQDTLIDKPRRRAKEDKLEKERSEDRIIQKELQGYTLKQAREDQTRFLERNQLADLHLANETAKAKEFEEKRRLANEEIDFESELQKMTLTADAFRRILTTGQGLGLINENSRGPRKNLETLLKYFKENVKANKTLAYESIGAHTKRVKEIDLLIKHWGGKTFPGGTDEYNKLMQETITTYKYNENIDLEHKGDLPVNVLMELLKLEKGHVSLLNNRKAELEKKEITLYKENPDGSTSKVKVFRGSSMHQQKVSKEGYSEVQTTGRPKPDSRKDRKEVREIDEKINKAYEGIAKIEEGRSLPGAVTTPTHLKDKRRLQGQIKELEQQKKDLQDKKALQQPARQPSTPAIKASEKKSEVPAAIEGLPPDKTARLTELVTKLTKTKGVEEAKRIAKGYDNPKDFLDALEKMEKDTMEQATVVPELPSEEVATKPKEASDIDYGTESAGLGGLGKVEKQPKKVTKKIPPGQRQRPEKPKKVTRKIPSGQKFRPEMERVDTPEGEVQKPPDKAFGLEMQPKGSKPDPTLIIKNGKVDTAKIKKAFDYVVGFSKYLAERDRKGEFKTFFSAMDDYPPERIISEIKEIMKDPEFKEFWNIIQYGQSASKKYKNRKRPK